MASPNSAPVLIAGAGIFGLTAALALRRRGHAVTVVEPGPLPRPEAASTDSSRAVRADYGADVFYTELAEAAIAGWEAWNAESGVPLYRADGFLFLVAEPMQPGEFEHESWRTLAARGYPLQRLDARSLRERCPAWSTGAYRDGYFNPRAGQVDARRTIAWLAGAARDRGVVLDLGARAVALLQRGDRVVGLRLADGRELRGDPVVVAAGAWTPRLVPWLADVLQPIAQPVCYFRAGDTRAFQAPRFPLFGADIARTGWYGFPATDEGVVKIANHGPGLRADPDATRDAPERAEHDARAFLRHALPELAHAPLVAARLCFYTDTFDGDFWIDRDPAHPGLVVATGGSGHAFKFAPVLGDIVADAVEDVRGGSRERFRWRSRGAKRGEAARRR